MTDPRWHLAQLNVGRLLAPLESEALSGFVAQLAPDQRARRRHSRVRLATADGGR